MFWVYAALAVSLVSFFVAAYFYNWVKKLPTANPKLDEVGALIREGAFTFLRREYRVLGLFSIIVMAVIFLFFPRACLGTARAWARNLRWYRLPVRHRAFGAGGLCGHLHRHAANLRRPPPRGNPSRSLLWRASAAAR